MTNTFIRRNTNRASFLIDGNPLKNINRRDNKQNARSQSIKEIYKASQVSPNSDHV